MDSRDFARARKVQQLGRVQFRSVESFERAMLCARKLSGGCFGFFFLRDDSLTAQSMLVLNGSNLLIPFWNDAYPISSLLEAERNG
jgi:hypothetical protein